MDVMQPRTVERWIEKVIFASRWLLAPLYLALAISLLGILIKVGQELTHFLPHILEAEESRVILDALSLIDLALTGSLIVIVIFSGYENFVSRIEPTGHQDWPEWMTKISFNGLKLKLSSSIVAISAVQLLRAFLDINNQSDRALAWSVGIHLTFIASALLLALMDRISSDDGH